MPLQGNQFEQVNNVLLNAFNRSSLRRMVRYELDVELDQVAGGENDSEVTYNLVMWAIHNGRLLDLISGALNQNPSNTSLQQLAADAKTWDLTGTDVTQFRPIGSPPATLVQGDVGTLVEGNVDVSGDGDFVGGDKVTGDKVAGDKIIYNVQPPKDDRERRNRQTMLKIMAQRVQEEQEQALFNEVFIALGMTERSDAVETPRSVLKVTKTGSESPQRTDIVDAFNDAQGSLLILGEPGTGKTTLLYELARHLVGRADDETEPIPVIFNLSSWANKELPLADWIAAEFRAHYGVTSKAAKPWIDEDKLILLLDGLDEVREDKRANCVAAIHRYQADRAVAISPIVVCCRTAEYKALPLKAELRQAVEVKQLSDEQITRYFCELYVRETKSSGELHLTDNRFSNLSSGDLDHYLQQLPTEESESAAVYAVLQQDETLMAESRFPLMLNIILMAFTGRATALTAVAGAGAEGVRAHVFDAYIKRMFEHRDREHVEVEESPYTDKQTVHWLQWMAGKMVDHDETVFQLDRIQPTWLDTKSDRRRYRLSGGLIFGLSGGLSGGLIFGLIFGLGVGLIGGLTENIEPIDTLSPSSEPLRRWSFWQPILIGGLIFGLIGGLIFGLIVGLSVGLSFGLSVGLVGLFFGLIEEWQYEIPFDTKTTLNHGIAQTAKIASIGGLSFGLIGGLIFGLIGGLGVGLGVGLIFGLIFGLIVGLPCIQHYALRFVLARRDYAPWNYPKFLKYAQERIFLRRVGSGFRFTHRLLKERFAELTDEDIKRIAGSADQRRDMI